MTWVYGLIRSCQCATMSHVSLRHASLFSALTCFFHLRRLRSVRCQLGRDVSAKLVSTLVLSCLDYCNAVLAGLPASTLAPLQRVLHAAARLVLDLKPHDHVTPTLRELHWLPVAQQIEYKLCLLVHKALIGHTPDYITDLLTPVASTPTRSSLRASSNGDLHLPRTEWRIGDLAFSVAASHAWTRLPIELKLMQSSITTFRRHLKTFLFSRAY